MEKNLAGHITKMRNAQYERRSHICNIRINYFTMLLSLAGAAERRNHYEDRALDIPKTSYGDVL